MSATLLSHLERAFKECAADLDALYARCAEAAPNYGVSRESFEAAVRAGANKYLLPAQTPEPAADDSSNGPASAPTKVVSPEELRQFIGDLQASDLYLAVACAAGNEHAWWEFDAGYRRFIERVAQHLAGSQSEAEEALDLVYTELYGTRVVEGVRQSKFATYSGRGSLRGWLRAIVWHAVVDLHRARRDEVTIDDWTEGGGETVDRPGWRGLAHSGETVAIEGVAQGRYGAATFAALEAAFASLDDHEKLLLLYYHVEGLKLREIARLVEEPQSPLRRWFQRQPRQRAGASSQPRVHESTVMRWLEKVYARIQKRFSEELRTTHGLGADEIKLCVEMAGGGFAPDNLERHLSRAAENNLGKNSAE